jgi:hypothetical protein
VAVKELEGVIEVEDVAVAVGVTDIVFENDVEGVTV